MKRYTELKKIYDCNYFSYSRELERDKSHCIYLGQIFGYLFGKIRHEVNNCIFLEIGCGKGFFVENFLKNGINAYGVDISQFALQMASAKIRKNVLVSYAEMLPFQNSVFDIILLPHVVEHVLNIDMLLHELCRVSKKNGLILIVIPVVPFGSVKYWRKVGLFSDKGHVSMFTSGYWMELFKKYDLKFTGDIQNIVCNDPPNYFLGRHLFNSGVIGRKMASIISCVIRKSFLLKVYK